MPFTQELPSEGSSVLGRRALFRVGGQATLSAVAIGLLSGTSLIASAGAAAPAQNPHSDVLILNSALSAEHEAIAAYQLGADSGLLEQSVKKLALTFQGHHRSHTDVLSQTIRKLGGSPVDARPQYDFPAAELNSQKDILKFAANLEKGAVSAYLGAVPLFGDRQLAKAAASILGDEAMHWAVLRQALGLEPVPIAFVS